MFATLGPLWARRAFVTLCAAVFVWLQSPQLIQVFTLLAFVLSGYAAAMVVSRWRNTAVLATYIIALTVAFVVLKRYAFLQLVAGDSLMSHALDLVGLSFIFFRQIHFVVDVKQGDIKDRTLWGYLCYQLNPFTLLAGPIQRYQRFHEDWNTLKPIPTDAHRVRMTLMRLLLGVVKVSFIGDACLYYATQFHDVHPSVQDLMTFYLFPAYVYFNFAGYCDIVISAAALVGIRVPENFDKPYVARNMIEFWTRWHRTLSFWIRDYVFTPLYMALARRQPGWAPNLAFVCYFVALFLAGVWHGSTWNFVIFGVLNGLGVSAAKLWEMGIVSVSGRQGLRQYLANEPIKWVARLATFHFVCVTQVFLRPGTEEDLMNLVSKLAGAVLNAAGLGG